MAPFHTLLCAIYAGACTNFALQATFINRHSVLTLSKIFFRRHSVLVQQSRPIRIADISLFQAILSLDGDPPVLRLFEERDYKYVAINIAPTYNLNVFRQFYLYSHMDFLIQTSRFRIIWMHFCWFCTESTGMSSRRRKRFSRKDLLVNFYSLSFSTAFGNNSNALTFDVYLCLFPAAKRMGLKELKMG